MKILDFFLLIVLVLVNVAFITLIERKVLSYSQLRLGPNKPAFIGLVQPMADAIKLFSNKSIIPVLIRNLFNYIPFLSLALVLLIWSLTPNINFTFSYSFRVLVLLIIIRITVYPILLAGWSSNRKFAGLGAVRNVAQTVSYEVALALLVSIIIIRFRIIRFSENLINFINLRLLPGLIIIWLIVALAETNRTPFDFAEGERELVSGFNTEYSSNKFAAVFIAEYARIYFLRALTSVLFVSFVETLTPFFTVLFIFFWIWVRATLPRHRYDFLIIINWKKILPLVLSLLSFSCLLYVIYNKI